MRKITIVRYLVINYVVSLPLEASTVYHCSHIDISAMTTIQFIDSEMQKEGLDINNEDNLDAFKSRWFED